jgi:LysR family transcriptional regulator, nitrogen assimilation regulatory protein
LCQKGASTCGYFAPEADELLPYYADFRRHISVLPAVDLPRITVTAMLVVTKVSVVGAHRIMNLRQLRYFIGVVEAGNMTRAAESMNVAQTALSMQVRQLEEDLGVPLLVRHSRGIEPTDAGKVLHARALAILKQIDDTRREVSAIGQAVSEKVRFGITPALMLTIGAALIERVRDNVPQVTFSLMEAMSHVLIENLLNDDLDYALCYDAPDLPQIGRTAFLQEDLVFVTLPTRGPGTTIALVDVLDEILAMPDAADTVRLAVGKSARDLGLELKVTYEVRSIAAMKSLALKGIASCVLPFASVVDEVKGRHLAAHPIVMPPIRRTLYLVSASRRRTPLCDAAISAEVRSSLSILLDALGALAHPLWVRTS